MSPKIRQSNRKRRPAQLSNYEYASPSPTSCSPKAASAWPESPKSPPRKKQASNKAKKFTKKRQAWVSDFKRSLRSSPLADDDKTGSEFLEKLLNFLKTKIPDLTIADLHSWIDHHPWITEQIFFRGQPTMTVAANIPTPTVQRMEQDTVTVEPAVPALKLTTHLLDDILDMELESMSSQGSRGVDDSGPPPLLIQTDLPHSRPHLRDLQFQLVAIDHGYALEFQYPESGIHGEQDQLPPFLLMETNLPQPGPSIDVASPQKDHGFTREPPAAQSSSPGPEEVGEDGQTPGMPMGTTQTQSPPRPDDLDLIKVENTYSIGEFPSRFQESEAGREEDQSLPGDHDQEQPRTLDEEGDEAMGDGECPLRKEKDVSSWVRRSAFGHRYNEFLTLNGIYDVAVYARHQAANYPAVRDATMLLVVAIDQAIEKLVMPVTYEDAYNSRLPPVKVEHCCLYDQRGRPLSPTSYPFNES